MPMTIITSSTSATTTIQPIGVSLRIWVKVRMKLGR
jgi:hypothetical protein